MTKRIIGIIATVAILAIVVFVALGFGSYKSMLPEDFLFGTDNAVEQLQSPESVEGDTAE